MNRLLVTGSRHHTNRELIEEELIEAIASLRGDVDNDDDVTLVVGDARGADDIAIDVFSEYKLPIERYIAWWNAEGKNAGPNRNTRMVESGADLCLAFPLSNSRGTIDCYTKAIAKHIPTRIVEERSDGAIVTTSYRWKDDE